jgi:hypothetical protein
MTKVSIIIFTYKRAILLDSAILFLFKNFKNLTLPVHVIYHYHPDHKDSYDLLKKKWIKKKVLFHERKSIKFLVLLKFIFFNPLNILWLFKWPDIYGKSNNFKFLLEKILKNIKADYISMMPDDQIFFKRTLIPEKVFNIISNSKKDYFYRFFTGDHFKGYNSLPKNFRIIYHNDEKVNFFEWSHKNSYFKNSPLWNYRFTIEGTVFNKDVLIKLLKNLLYHNPITLEAIGLWEARFRSFFRKGLSAQERTAAGYQINSVQNYVYHFNNNFNPEILMKAYLKGYRLLINKSIFKRNKFDVVPKNIFFKKRNLKKISYYNLKVNLL